MAFMVPVVKNDYDIYSKSPPKNKPIVPSNNGKSQSQINRRQQSNSISIGVLQHNQHNQHRNLKQSPRIHSKSMTESNQRNERQRSTSSSSTSSSESLEIIRKMMHFISFSDSSDNEKQSKSPDHHKTHWTAKIFKKRTNSLSSQEVSKSLS